jgi:hypothetical protein
LKALAQGGGSGRGNCEQTSGTTESPDERVHDRISPPEVNIVADSFHLHPPRMVRTGQHASLTIL